MKIRRNGGIPVICTEAIFSGIKRNFVIQKVLFQEKCLKDCQAGDDPKIASGIREYRRLQNSGYLDDSILGLIKEKNGEKLVALFNFSEYDKVAWINEEDGMYEDLISGRQMEARGVQIPAFGCYWLLKK